MGKVVLVTGVSRDLGRRFARGLAAHPDVERVVGVDAVPPRDDIGDVSFVRADIRNPVIAKVIAKEDVDTVVHMSVIATPGSAGGRGTMKELNVIGTMQLLAACQKASGIRHLVVKSTSTVYGASNRDPAMFREDMEPRRAPSSGYAKDVAEIEGYVRSFARRRPDVGVTTLRLANVLGPHVTSPITSYFRLPVIPTVLGFDPRLQFVHEHDLMRVLDPCGARGGARHLQHRRRRRDAAVAGRTPAPQADRVLAPSCRRRPGRAAQVGADGRLLARAARLPHLRSRHRHHPDARRSRLRAGLHHGRRRSPTSRPPSVIHRAPSSAWSTDWPPSLPHPTAPGAGRG